MTCIQVIFDPSMVICDPLSHRLQAASGALANMPPKCAGAYLHRVFTHARSASLAGCNAVSSQVDQVTHVRDLEIYAPLIARLTLVGLVSNHSAILASVAPSARI
jgi:hypothetical protein